MLTTLKARIYCLLIVFELLFKSVSCCAQPELEVEKWVSELSDKSYKKDQIVRDFIVTLEKTDSAKGFQFLDELANKGAAKGHHFQARLNCLRARTLYYKNIWYQHYQKREPVNQGLIKDQITKLLSSAIDIAYKSEDDYLIAFVSHTYASIIIALGETGLAVMYIKNSVDLYEKLSYNILPESYQILAELLYRVREYDDCIRYAKKAVTAWQNSPNEIKGFTVSCMNTVALGYHRQSIYDSALLHYDNALKLAKQINNAVWTGIVSGNIGQVFYSQKKYDTAYALLKMDYRISEAAAFYDNAANSLQWAARTNLARDNKAEALSEVRQAFRLLNLWPDANYLRNTYYTAAQIFREMKDYDSAFYYSNLYATINDSIEKVVATSSLAITKAKLNDETSRYNIQSLNKEKRAQLLLRNIIIAAVVTFSFIAILAINRQRLKEKMEKGKSEQEKLRMEMEVGFAKEQMKMFTENIIEKTSLIEKLDLQVKNREASSEHHTIVTELTQQTILTEEEWLKFKSLFEKIYPGFFISLKQNFPEITVAEQRMAALIRLQLTTKQAAAMLGISVDSVHKTRQRLRQRLQLGADSRLEDIVTAI